MKINEVLPIVGIRKFKRRSQDKWLTIGADGTIRYTGRSHKLANFNSEDLQANDWTVQRTPKSVSRDDLLEAVKAAFGGSVGASRNLSPGEIVNKIADQLEMD